MRAPIAARPAALPLLAAGLLLLPAAALPPGIGGAGPAPAAAQSAAASRPDAAPDAPGARDSATAGSPSARAAAIRDARRLLDSLLAARRLPGLSVAVGVGGEVAWSEGLGFADLETREPVTPLTKFRVGSVSKSLTSAAVGQLAERGRLDLDAPVQRYVPAFPLKRWPVTTRLAAGHLAGIRHYRDGEFLSARRYGSVEEGLRIFASDSLLFEPGTDYRYSSYGWNLVSAVVEGASGEPFLGYMRRHVFGPAGMRHTIADHADSLIAWRTEYYGLSEDSVLLNGPYVDNSYKWAGGGFLSTPEDLVRFAGALLEGRLARPETVELLFASQRTADGEETGYGIGWSSGEDADGRRMAWHGGGSVGGTTMLLLYPEEEVTVALAVNLSDAPLSRELAERVAAGFLAPVEAR